MNVGALLHAFVLLLKLAIFQAFPLILLKTLLLPTLISMTTPVLGGYIYSCRFADPKAPAVKERGSDFLANIWSPNLTFANRRYRAKVIWCPIDQLLALLQLHRAEFHAFNDLFMFWIYSNIA